MSLAQIVRFPCKYLVYLPTLKEQYKPSGGLSDVNFWHIAKISRPILSAVQAATKTLEEQYGCGTWENLDIWISSVEGQVDNRLQLFSKLLDINAPNGSKALRDLRRGPMATEAYRNLGPYWESSLRELYRVWGFSIGKALIPSNKISPGIRKKADAILNAWNELKGLDRSGIAEQFRTKWMSQGLNAREFFINKWHGSVHELPDAYVYEIARRQESDWKRIDHEAFKAPLLNMEDLIYSDNLPCLLESRLKYHPRLLLPVDGRGVTTGLFCACLPELPCESRLSINFVNEGYPFLWNDKGSCNPAAIFHQLEAQGRLYSFLQTCVKDFSLESSTPEVEPKIRAPLSSLTAQMARIDYAPSNSIDFPFILRLLNCSLNDARDDLYDLRIDADLWSTRVSSTIQDGRCATFLRQIFVRIDYFDRIKTLVETLLQDGMSSSIRGTEEIDGRKEYMAVEIALQRALDEITATLSKGSWPKRISNRTLSGLINLIRNQHTILWVMGHRVVLRAIEHELSSERSRCDLPSDMMRALHDISVVAYCLRETQKYRVSQQSLQGQRSTQLF